ncbi:MAG: hypothetical protein ACXWV4_12385, partial [Flavitalea sp.]
KQPIHPKSYCYSNRNRSLYRYSNERSRMLSHDDSYRYSPGKRKNYDIRNGFNVRKEEHSLKPGAIVRQAEELRNYVLTLNLHTLDYDALRYHILKILSDYNIDLLEGFPEYRSKVVHNLMSITRYLRYQNSLEILRKLKKLAGEDPELRLTVGKFHLNQRRKYRRQQFFPIWVLLLTLVLLVMLHLLS